MQIALRFYTPRSRLCATLIRAKPLTMTPCPPYQPCDSTQNIACEILRGVVSLRGKLSAGVPLSPSRVSLQRLQEKLLFHLSQCARLYEQGRLRSLDSVERYITHWLRWSKGIGIASSNALDAIQYAITQLCETPHANDVMVNTFARCILQRGKTEQKKKLNYYEKDNYYVNDRSRSYSCG